MMPLEQWQTRFLQAITDKKPSGFGLAHSHIPEQMSWNIYRRNYKVNHIAALADTYKNVQRILGSAFFKQLANEYVCAYRHGSGDLNDYGEHFAEFIAHFITHMPQQFNGAIDLCYLPDIAQLDWAIFSVLRAPLTEGNALQALPLMTEDQRHNSRIKLYPTSRILVSAYPLYALWCLAEGDDQPVDINAGGQSVLVHRYQGKVRVIVLQHEQTALLQLWQEHPLHAALERLISQYPAANIGEMFQFLNHYNLVGELW